MHVIVDMLVFFLTKQSNSLGMSWKLFLVVYSCILIVTCVPNAQAMPRLCTFFVSRISIYWKLLCIFAAALPHGFIHNEHRKTVGKRNGKNRNIKRDEKVILFLRKTTRFILFVWHVSRWCPVIISSRASCTAKNQSTVTWWMSFSSMSRALKTRWSTKSVRCSFLVQKTVARL